MELITTFFGLKWDILSISMGSFVLFLSIVLFKYAATQFRGEKRLIPFQVKMTITLLGALLQIFSPSLVQFAMGWLIVSLGLQGLLQTESHRPLAKRSARLKFIFSRVGDIAMLGACISLYKNPDVFMFLPPAPYFMVVAAYLKTASLPFHGWLIGSIEAPTPVSALLHAGIVNAGGFMLIRFQSLLVEHPAALLLLGALALPSVILGPIVMWAQTDYKRSLAWSTVGQMGFMLLQCALGGFAPALLHLFGHGLYKANAFLRSGTLAGVAERPLKEIESKVNLFHIALAFLFSYGGLSLGYAVTGNTQVTLPGGVFLCVLQGLALSQWTLSPTTEAASFAKRLIQGFLLGIFYALLTIGFEKMYHPVMTANVSWKSQGIGGILGMVFVLLGILFLISLWLRQKAWLQSSRSKAFWIAAAHGFYLDTPKIISSKEAV